MNNQRKCTQTLTSTKLQHFVIMLLIGVFSGTYSSIFNAAALLVVWEYREWGTWFRGKPAVPAQS